jgi:hypothetical protein
MATLLMAELHPIGGPEIWPGNQILTSISSRIPVHLDEDGCPLEVQPFPQAAFLLRKLASLWEHGIHNWSQIVCRGPNGRPYFMEDREMQWAKPSIKFPLPEALTRALDYLRILLSTRDHTQLLSLCKKLTEPNRPDYSIAPRWRNLMGQNWDSLLDKPSPIALDNATKQLSIESYLSKRAAVLTAANGTNRTRIRLHFPIKKKTKTPRGQTGAKRVQSITIEPLRGSDAPGDKASIQQIFARSELRRVRHNHRSTCVEEFLVQWGQEHCTFGEALEQYNLGFDIVSITSLDDTVPTQSLLPFVAAKRPTSAQWRELRRPPLTTTCVVQFAPPP